MACDFERIKRAVAALNAEPQEPLACGSLSVRYLHWGVTPPAFWRSPRQSNPCEIHKHTYYEVCHAFEGRGTFLTFAPNELQREVAAGDTFFARPGLQHCYGGRKGQELGICFWSFSIERAPGAADRSSSMLAAFSASEQTLVHGDETMRSILDLLFAEMLNTGGAGARPLLQYLALHLASAASAGRSAAADVSVDPSVVPPPLLWRARQYIQNHCHRDLRIEELAERCGYSRRHLARMFRETLGVSFTEHLAQARIQTACHLLLNDSVPLKQVARRSGFGSLPAFTRAFRRHMDLTPGEYRARSLGAVR